MFSSRSRLLWLILLMEETFLFLFSFPVFFLGSKVEKRNNSKLQKWYLKDLFVLSLPFSKALRVKDCFNQEVSWLPLASNQSCTRNWNSSTGVPPLAGLSSKQPLSLVNSYLALHPFSPPAASPISQICFYSIVGPIYFLSWLSESSFQDVKSW